MESSIQVDLGRIAQDLQIRRVQVEGVVHLLDEGNTVPFITRYRKERTGNLNEVVIREIQTRVRKLRELAERKQTILKSIEAQGKLTEELGAAIRSAENSKRLEDLYLPFKPKKRSKAVEARDRGLEPLANAIASADPSVVDLSAAAAPYLNPEKQLETVEKVLEGAGHIIAENFNETPALRDTIRRLAWKTAKLVASKGDLPDAQSLEYRDYFNFSEPIGQLPPHRILALNRGEKENILKVRIEIPRGEVEAASTAMFEPEKSPHAEFMKAALADALDRLLLPSLEREIRRDLSDVAERHAVDVFARNVRALLLQPPVMGRRVLAIDPGLRSGCKIAVLDEHGELLEHSLINPHPPHNRRFEAKQALKDFVAKHQVSIIAIGNGTASRETESLVAEIIAEGIRFVNSPESSAAVSPALEPQTPREDAQNGEVSATIDSQPVEEASSAVLEQPIVETPTAEEPTLEPPTLEAPSAEAVAEESTPSHQEVSASETVDANPSDIAPSTEVPAETPAEAPAETPGQPNLDAAPALDDSKPQPALKTKMKERAAEPQPEPEPTPHPADALLAKLVYLIVNEAGASHYSTSPIAREEFPELDATLRGTISIGKRLLDPLAELVKIDPQNLGVGLYQHDVHHKQLKETLESVVESCVNFVGVNLNSASAPLLRYVSGLNQVTARRLVDHRKEKGPFKNRGEIQQIEGIGPATFTQTAGFLKIREGENPLDQTWVHPESYPAAEKLLAKLELDPSALADKEKLHSLVEKFSTIDFPATARELEIGEATLHDICEALARPDRDPREDLPKPIFKTGIRKLEDLELGMELTGTVLNVVDFGAFVDVGLKDSGLVHISQLANRYVRSPHDVVCVGDIVKTWVLSVDLERKRVSLTMVRPGSERGRAEAGAPATGERGRPRRPQREGGERAGAAAGPGRPNGRSGGPRPPQQSQSPAQPPAVNAEGTIANVGDQPPQHRSSEGRPPAHAPRHAQSTGGGPPRGPRPPMTGGGPGPGGPGRGPGGPRPPQHAQAGGAKGRFDRAAAPRTTQRKSKPSAPLPPLSQDALAGNVPLRTFGQLKQLWQARVEDPPGENEQTAGQPPTAGFTGQESHHQAQETVPSSSEQARPEIPSDTQAETDTHPPADIQASLSQNSESTPHEGASPSAPKVLEGSSEEQPNEPSNSLEPETDEVVS